MYGISIEEGRVNFIYCLRAQPLVVGKAWQQDARAGHIVVLVVRKRSRYHLTFSFSHSQRP